jgi:hypothetical protein
VHINPFANKRAIVNNMSDGDSEYQRLLDTLPTKELRILQKNPDLIAEVRRLTKLTLTQAESVLEKEYDLTIDQWQTQDLVIGTDLLDVAIPKWFTTSHCGWFKSAHGGVFLGWAREFLLQEVRINLWIRYLEHKAKRTPDVGHGTYL